MTFRERDFRGPEVVQVARTVENSRSAQSHALNHRSSRSHCLITLSLRQIDAKGGNPMDPWAHRAGLLGGLPLGAENLRLSIAKLLVQAGTVSTAV